MLNSRQWDLYKLIENSSFEGKRLSVQDICAKLPEHYQSRVSEHNFSNCPLIYKDIDELNASDEVGYIIIKKNNQFFVGDEDEAYAYLRKVYYRMRDAIDKYKAIDKKFNEHDQGRILSRKLDPIDEKSSAKKFNESYFNDFDSLTWDSEKQELKKI